MDGGDTRESTRTRNDVSEIIKREMLSAFEEGKGDLNPEVRMLWEDVANYGKNAAPEEIVEYLIKAVMRMCKKRRF